MFRVLEVLGGTLIGFSITAQCETGVRFYMATIGLLTWATAAYSEYYLTNQNESF